MSTNNVYYDGSSGHSDVNMGLGLDDNEGVVGKSMHPSYP